MAKERKKPTYKIDEKNKIVIIYSNMEQTAAEKQFIKDYYLDAGYTLKLVERKINPTVEEMMEALKNADMDLYNAFVEAYNTKLKKTEKGEKAKFNESGFAKACKIYNTWDKARREAEKKAQEEAE